MTKKIALAMMFQNEVDWLKLHVPAMLSAVDGVVALDGGSADGGDEWLRSIGAEVYAREFDWNFGAQAQFLLECVERSEVGYDYILRLDPDEIMFPEDIISIKSMLESGKYHLLHLPRVNFIRDRLHYSKTLDVFNQWRAWTLHKGIKYHDVKVHETPKVPANSGIKTHVVNQRIFHYGNIKDAYDRHFRGLVYKSIIQKEDMPVFDPVATPWYPNEPFTDAQPLDPYEIGFRAPLSPTSMNYHLSANLAGDRAVEYGFCVENINKFATRGGRALDFGSGGVSVITDALVTNGMNTNALDREMHTHTSTVKFIHGDILSMDIGNRMYDLVVICSSVEHVGLSGRYGEGVDTPDGDYIAMRKIVNSVKPGGKIILTLPVGTGYIHKPMHRVYGPDRISVLLDNEQSVIHSEFYQKHGGSWRAVDRDKAFSRPSISVSETDWQGCLYNLGCYVLEV